MIAAPQAAPVVTLTQTAAARYVVLDIETGDAPEDAIQAALGSWKAPKNWKPETVEKNRAEAAEKIRSKAALLDASPILCVGARTDREAIMFNGMGEAGPLELSGWSVRSYPDEGAMLAGMAAWLDTQTDADTILIGHNVRAFDLPKIRGAFVRHRLALPACLKPRTDGSQPMTDTMSLFKSFSMEHRDAFAVGLDVVCTAFGIPRPKQVISGDDVPRLHREGHFAEILIYNAIDVDATTEIYRLMMA
ncbi:ribonuclease H-like domain-containing protein [Imhoffiella purpurea]|uniref:Predicted 3'-5' exonuclease PolB-like domain-containing protein n=1 Tax=Imhoffiella purpurea TaxID=1249627 RepID=W9VIX1_9GAMM|nr:ribonuclease H-like domain-containing protein [Imhoffiella purpurea]EXJ16946.1 hypothetical protein D779_1769 [Imhoffiella purpurea]